MIEWSVLSVFIPTFFLVSLTPGLCMTLALSLGMTQGMGRTLWMMGGELVGVGLVALCSMIGVAAVMLHYPAAFAVFKWLGGAYLIWIGAAMWRERGRMALPASPGETGRMPRGQLAGQGFVTAVANPKGWAFDIALLPPFVNPDHAIAPQLVFLLGVLLLIEFIALLLYAGGGHTARRLLACAENVRLLNRIAGSLVIGVGVWLALG